MTLKVYATWACYPSYLGQCLAVCATTSWREFARLVTEQSGGRISPETARRYGSVTHNEADVAVATAQPGVVFARATRDAGVVPLRPLSEMRDEARGAHEATFKRKGWFG